MLLLALALASAPQTVPVADPCRACPVPGSSRGCSNIAIACQPTRPRAPASGNRSPLSPASVAEPSGPPLAARPAAALQSDKRQHGGLLGLLGVLGLIGLLGLRRAGGRL